MREALARHDDVVRLPRAPRLTRPATRWAVDQ